MAMDNRISVRLKLSDFINTKHEPYIMDYVIRTYEKFPFFLKFWYDENEIENDDLEKFIDKYQSKLKYRTMIQTGSEIPTSDFVWFDILNKNDYKENQRHRFLSTYEDLDELFNSLVSFSECGIFCSGEKPRKQKRNDYESSDSRE